MEPKHVERMLKVGFKPSKSGSYGSGVYLTNSFKMAFSYGKNSFINDEGASKNPTYMFVNKVRHTDPEEPPRKLSKVKLRNFSFAKSNSSVPIYKNGKKTKKKSPIFCITSK